MEFVNPKKIINSCQQILRESLRSQVEVSPESDNPQENRYSLNLQGFDSLGTTDRGLAIKVVPFLENFWLHFSINFKVLENKSNTKRYDYIISGVSIAIFYGLATDQNKLLMFRAEWDNKTDDEISVKHPQPHWHIHNVGDRIGIENISDFEVFLQIKEDTQPNFLDTLESPEIKPYKYKRTDISSFHFAMSASWFLGGSTNHDLTEQNLKIWLTEIVKHIRQQINYCL